MQFYFWHLIALFLGLKFLRFVFNFCNYEIKKLSNIAKASRLRKERDDKHFSFKPIAKELGDKLKIMDCTDIRKGLMDNEFTSVDLINFFGERC